MHEELATRAWGKQGTRRAPKSKFVRVLTFFSCRWPVCIPDAFPTFIHVAWVPRKNINDFIFFLSGDSFSLPFQGGLQGGDGAEGRGQFCIACNEMETKTKRSLIAVFGPQSEHQKQNTEVSAGPRSKHFDQESRHGP